MTLHPAPGPATDRCAHCALPLTPETTISARIADQLRRFCCHGCRGAYQLIHGAGLESFYTRRRWDAPGLPDGAYEPRYDDAELSSHVVLAADGAELTFLVEGIRCASCVWLNEKILAALPGVQSARLNYGTHRARVRFDPDQTSPAQLFGAVLGLGYLPRPFTRSAVEESSQRERRQLLIRFGTAFFLSMQLMGYSFALYAGYFQGIDTATRQLLQLFAAAVTTPVVFYAGWPFLAGAWRSLVNRAPNMDLLIALGVLAAYGHGLHALAVGGEVYFDTAAMIVTLVLAGRLCEFAARRHAATGLDRLLHLAPERATRIEGEELREVPSSALALGDLLLVRPGERFPTDAQVRAGESQIDASAATGEAQPVSVAPGSVLLSGTLNLGAVLTVEVTARAGDSFLARVARLVEEAQARRAPIQSLADRVSARFVPGVIVLALATFLYWSQQPTEISPLLAAVAVLIIACPCALGLATPTAILVASGAAAARGILFRGGDVLEAAGQLDTVAFDKTGTLTEGRPEVVRLVTADGDEEAFLAQLAALEAGSRHPLAQGIERAARACGLAPFAVPNACTLPGRGVTAESPSGLLVAGNAQLLQEQGIECPPLPVAPGETPVHLGAAGRWLGTAFLADTLRPSAAPLLAWLRRQGLRTVLLTGDLPANARAIAAHVPLDELHSQLTPAQKADHVRAAQQRGERILMAGDGINDAPALSQADVGCAMAGGTDIALETSDLILVRPDLAQLRTALTLARRTLKIIRQNLAWAFGYNLLALPLAAAGMLAPIHAALAMALSSVCVIGNSLRLSRLGPTEAEEVRPD